MVERDLLHLYNNALTLAVGVYACIPYCVNEKGVRARMECMNSCACSKFVRGGENRTAFVAGFTIPIDNTLSCTDLDDRAVSDNHT